MSKKVGDRKKQTHNLTIKYTDDVVFVNRLIILKHPTIFAVLVWLHRVNVVCNEVEKKRLSFNLNYRSVNIIGLVLHRVCSELTTLISRVCPEKLTVQLLNYLKYNAELGVFQLLSKYNGFVFPNHRHPRTPSIRPTMPGEELKG